MKGREGGRVVSRLHVLTLNVLTTYTSLSFSCLSSPPLSISLFNFFSISVCLSLSLTYTYSFYHSLLPLGIAQSLGSQCYVSKGRYKVLQCLESKEILSLVNSHSPLTSPVHVMPLNKMNLKVSTCALIWSNGH